MGHSFRETVMPDYTRKKNSDHECIRYGRIRPHKAKELFSDMERQVWADPCNLLQAPGTMKPKDGTHVCSAVINRQT